MLKRTISLLSKANTIRRLPLAHLEVAPCLVSKINAASFSTVFKPQLIQNKTLHTLTRFNFASTPSHQKLSMPALSPTMEQGNIVKWNVKEGDKVSAGEAICDVETDKATLSFDVQDEGYVAKILVGDGAKGVKVGTPIVILVDSKDDIKAFADYKAESGSTGAQETKKETPKREEQPEKKESDSKPAAAKESGQGKTEASKHEAHAYHSENIKGEHRKNVMIRFGRQGAGASASHGHGDRVAASPLARRLAKEKNIDLSQVSGSGPNGRIIKQDILEYKPKAATTVAPEKAEKAAEKPKAQAPKLAAGAAPAQYTDTEISETRQGVNKALLDSKLSIPYFYLKIEIQLENINGVVEKLNKLSKTHISVNDIFIKAAGLACNEVPEVNSHWYGTFIRKYKNADIALIVDTPEGFRAPVVRSANTKGLLEIATSAKKLSEKAMNQSLDENDTQGATFSISDLGNTNVTFVTDIIAQPQSCLLGIGKKGKKVIPDGEGYKEVNIVNVTLIGDHRVVDGAVGAKWLQVFKSKLENPLSMLL